MGSKGGGGSQIVGYKYYFDFLMGICRGHIDQLVALRVGDLPLWAGNTGHTTRFQVSKPDLFGGDKGEGGIEGEVSLFLGADDQVVPADIKNAIAGGGTDGNEGTWTFIQGVGTSDQGATAEIAADISDFKGVTTLYYSGQISSNSPYPKPWKARTRRAIEGWDAGGCWYPERAVISYAPRLTAGSVLDWNASSNIPALVSGVGIAGATYNVSVGGNTELDGITSWASGEMVSFNGGTSTWQKITNGETIIKAMNPAHILYQCLTDRSWGRGMARDEIDDASWTYAANYLFNESFGLCIRWSKDGDINDFIQSVVDHIGAALYIDRGTGLMVLRLIRNDYTESELPLFDYNSGLISLETEETGASTIIANEIVVKWHDPIRDQDRQTRVHNLASIQSLGYPISQSREFLGIADPDLAQRVALRELQVGSAGIKRFKLKFDRRAWRIQPGMVMRVSAPDKGINDIILRVATYDDGTMLDGTISMDCIQDVFGMPSTVFITPVDNTTRETPRGPTPAIIWENVQEATYLDMVRGLSASQFDSVTDTDGGVIAAAGRPSVTSTSFMLNATPSGGALAQSVSTFAPTGVSGRAMSPYEINLFLSNGVDLAGLSAGVTAMFGSEMVQVTAFTPSSGLVVIARGGVDTIPMAHAAGETIIFNDVQLGGKTAAYTAGELIDVQLLNVTSSGVEDVTQTVHHAITIAARHFMPYVMGDLRLNGTPCLSTDALGVTGNAVFTWASRNRLLQDDQFLAHGAGAVAAEAGTTYTVEVRNGVTDALIRTHSGISASTYTYDAAEKASGAPDPIQLTFVFYTMRSGVRSYSVYRVPVYYVALGEGVGKASGIGLATAFGNARMVGVGTAAGLGRTSGRGVGLGIVSGTGHATGVGGTLSPPAVGRASGVGAAITTSNTLGFIAMIGAAAGVGAAIAASVATGTIRGNGAAAGAGLATAVGGYRRSVTGVSAGLGAATAAGLSIGTLPMTGTASGVGTATGGRVVTPRLGLSGSGTATETNTLTGSISTQRVNEIVIFAVYAEIADGFAEPPMMTVTGGGLTWNRRTRKVSLSGIYDDVSGALDVWWAHVPTIRTNVTITATSDMTFDDAACIWFGVSEVASFTAPFDPHPILPVVDDDITQNVRHPASVFSTAKGDAGGDFVFMIVANGTGSFFGDDMDGNEGQTPLVSVDEDGGVNYADIASMYRNDTARNYDQPFSMANFVYGWISYVDALTADLGNVGGALGRGIATGVADAGTANGTAAGVGAATGASRVIIASNGVAAGAGVATGAGSATSVLTVVGSSAGVSIAIGISPSVGTSTILVGRGVTDKGPVAGPGVVTE